MPIYEYRCEACGRISTYLLLNRAEEAGLTCKKCGSPQLTRLLSRVVVRLSEDTRLERLADPARFGGLDENDPRSMAKFMKEMAAATGEDLDKEEFDQMLEEAATETEGGGQDQGLEDEDF